MKRLALVLVAATAACGGGALLNVGQSVARIGAAAMPIGPEKEREIGFGIAATVAGRYRLLADAELTRYVNLVGQTVAQQSIRGAEIEFHFGVLDTDDVNAFAAPGGFIFITRGALRMMNSEAELAGVLAHEVSHVDEKQVLEQIRRSDVLKTARDEASLDGPLLDKLSELGTSALFMGLSRKDEMEADSLGLLYAAATGYRPDGLIRFLSNLEAAEAANAHGTAEWKATHPSTTERLQALRSQLGRHGLDPEAGVDAADRFRRYVRKTG